MSLATYHDQPETFEQRQSYPCADDRFVQSNHADDAEGSSPLFRDVYDELIDARLDSNTKRRRALAFLQTELDRVAATDDDLPSGPGRLAAWMDASAKTATAAYRDYLAGRKSGQPRRFFQNRAHALYFLQSVAPTKLVDGSWLYGTLRYRHDQRMAGLVQTYLEELGNGDASKNHVVLYRELLQANGLTEGHHLGDEHAEQGAIQLALGLTTEQMLPEVIGFNLGYEQLPLHLLISAYELNELGIDPYYFTLHVTVDNADSGHARKAVDAVALNEPRYTDMAEYWNRVRRGYRLNDLGLSTQTVIESFDIEEEVLRIFNAKAAVGAGAHSDYCRIEGLTVNEWLGKPGSMRGFLEALQRKGWITTDGTDPGSSRFWKMLVGERADMFGVFSDYELQVIYDWMRGPASADGAKFDSQPLGSGVRRRPLSFRAQKRLEQQRESGGVDLIAQLSPGQHWTAEGMAATQQVVATVRSG